MHFRPHTPIEGSSAVELWDGEQHVATIYAQSAGVLLTCEHPAHEALAVAIDPPHGHVAISITRDRTMRT